MPSIVFAVTDALNHVFTPGADGTVTDGANGGTVAALSTLLQSTGIGSFHMDPNLSATPGGGTALCEIRGGNIAPALIQTWDVDYDRLIQPVPDGARVKKLIFRRPRSINYIFDTSNNGDNSLQSGIFSDSVFTIPVYFTAIPFTPSYIFPFLQNESIVGIPADEVLFDHTGGPIFITKQELIDNWSSFNNNIGSILIKNQNPSGSTTLAGSLTFGLGWTVTVEYEESFEWTIPQDPSEPISEGSTVNLISPEGAPLSVDFEDVTQIDILIPDYNNPGTFITVNVPSNTWSNISPTTLSFIMPSWAGNLPTVVQVQLTSAQFGGTVSKQLYTILFVSASGIYELVPGKTSDTLYIEEEPGETIDVKIPNPFGRTGYFGK